MYPRKSHPMTKCETSKKSRAMLPDFAFSISGLRVDS